MGGTYDSGQLGKEGVEPEGFLDADGEERQAGGERTGSRVCWVVEVERGKFGEDLGGWVGGWVGRGERGGWNEVLYAGVGWVGDLLSYLLEYVFPFDDLEDGGRDRCCCGVAVWVWVGGWVDERERRGGWERSGWVKGRRIVGWVGECVGGWVGGRTCRR